ncbi:hypothetical protein GCM10011321_31810 [Youhaiella tibetensis]|nr:hypothetical protein GCM10011321_31810 [Youhaiella tibetensis]
MAIPTTEEQLVIEAICNRALLAICRELAGEIVARDAGRRQALVKALARATQNFTPHVNLRQLLPAEAKIDHDLCRESGLAKAIDLFRRIEADAGHGIK